MKKKLLVFHPVIAPYRIDFFNSLWNAFDAKIVLFAENLSDNKFQIDELYKDLEFTPAYLLERRGIGQLKYPKGVWRTISSFSPDMVMVGEFGLVTMLVILYKVLSLKRFKIVTICDDSYDMIANDNYFSRRHEKARQILMPFIDEIINVEPRVANWYKEKYGKGLYFPIIVDDKRYRERLQRTLPISHDLVESYHLEGKKVLLYVGRLIALKNLAFVIDCFKKAAINNAVFVIVGDGTEREKLQSMATGNVIFTGRLEGDQLYAWYNIAQLFTLASTQEAFGAVTNEALLGGCTALVSNLAGSNCLISEEENGNTFSPYDKQSFIMLLEKWFAKVQPLSLPLSLRTDMMREKYNKSIDKLSAALYSLLIQ